MPEAVQILRVAVPTPLHRCFDYTAPTTVDALPGMRVRVPFGRRMLVGMVLDLPQHSGHDNSKLKPVDEILDPEPIVSAHWLELCQWVCGYYHHPPGEVIATALPTALRKGAMARYHPPRGWSITDEGLTALQEEQRLSRAIRQRTVLTMLAQQNPMPEDRLRDKSGASAATIRSLSEKGWIKALVMSDQGILDTQGGPALNLAQQQALQVVTGSSNRFHPSLLQGITGSGKTEVYLALAHAQAKEGRQTLVLVPEIGLTPALIERFTERLGSEPAVLHSGLSDGERLYAWQRAAHGHAKVIIGTRSAIFTPLANPGAIIVDEEHDTSYKQQDGLRYSARDVAVRRAQMLDIPIVLGSATPSLESLQNAGGGRYQLAELPTRAGVSAPPSIEVIDLRRQPMNEGISANLLKHMHGHLAAGGQVMLFLNRRGFAPTLTCHDCGWVADCQRCDVQLTYHRHNARLRCHHCGSDRPVPPTCPECDGTELLAQGIGTERVEDFLKTEFPHIGIVRIDRDTTRRKNAMHELLEEISSKRARILVGTQMLAKGHDFPELSMVGILNADGGLFGIDFRAPERMAQLITQVSGRAGRGERAGEVFIQTHHPDHPLLLGLLRDGYEAFATQALAERQAAAYPPYGYLCLIRAEAAASESPVRFLETAAIQARLLATKGIEIWEAVPAPMERRAGRYRAQLLIQAGKRPALHKLLDQLIPALNDLPLARKVRWSVDVDPVDML